MQDVKRKKDITTPLKRSIQQGRQFEQHENKQVQEKSLPLLNNFPMKRERIIEFSRNQDENDSIKKPNEEQRNVVKGIAQNVV